MKSHALNVLSLSLCVSFAFFFLGCSQTETSAVDSGGSSSVESVVDAESTTPSATTKTVKLEIEGMT